MSFDRFKTFGVFWKGALYFSLLWVAPRVCAAELMSPPPYGPIIYQPYVGARIYSAILESTLQGGRRGLSFYGVLSTSHKAGPSTFAVAAAFPFTKTEDPRTRGWAFGFGYGQTSYSYEPNRYMVPSLRFTEIMIGRTSVEGRADGASDGDERTGFGGYFEITLRDEEPRTNPELDEFVAFYHRDLPEHRRSINFRIGAVSGLGGVGYVEQKPSSWLGHSFHLGVTLPFMDNQATLLHLQVKGFVYCQANWWLCGVNVEAHHARSAFKIPLILEDVQNQAFIGPWMQFYFQKKYVLGFSTYWVITASEHRSVYFALPIVKSTFSIAF